MTGHRKESFWFYTCWFDGQQIFFCLFKIYSQTFLFRNGIKFIFMTAFKVSLFLINAIAKSLKLASCFFWTVFCSLSFIVKCCDSDKFITSLPEVSVSISEVSVYGFDSKRSKSETIVLKISFLFSLWKSPWFDSILIRIINSLCNSLLNTVFFI